jgi:arginine exporter protein ArgO
MRLRWIIDKLLRILAALTVALAAVLVFFAGVFGSDSGTTQALTISMAILLGGGTVLALLAVAIVSSPMQKAATASSPGGGIPLATLLVYLVALAGVAAFCCRNLIFAGV